MITSLKKEKMRSMRLSSIAAALVIALPIYAQETVTLPSNTEQASETSKAENNADSKTKEQIEVVTVTGVYQADLKARDGTRQ